jgi:DNA-binding SARP family transcriptional activator/tetratricopeptide (TPR) repeat protein
MGRKCDMAPLTIRLLGSPEITAAGQPLSFRTRKVLALLVYLVVEGGMHSREALMTLLWSEIPAPKAAVNLRVTLSRLRKALQPAGELLLTAGAKAGFDFRCPVDLDLAWLSAAVLPESTPDDLAAIREFDRGEFLAGFSLADAPEFDTWAAIQRESCQRQVEAVYDRLTQHQLAKRDITAAVDTARRWVVRAPLSEAAYRRLMTAQALGGDRTAALKTFAECRAMLQEEFGIEPAQDTAVLAENIGCARTPQAPGAAKRAPGRPLAKPPTAGRRGLLLPFEGRAEEHRQLVAAFRRANQGGAGVVALIGAAGVGKTRLVSAFRDWAILDSPGVEIWDGRAFEMGGRLAYQPVIEGLRLRLERENAPEDLLDDVWLAELSQLMPELRARYPDLPQPMTGDASFVRSRLFSAVATLGSALAARNPALFILEDMQRSDADTRDMVHYLARRWAEGGAPILLLLTIRQENYAGDLPLREWLAQLGRDVPFKRLLLDTLGGTAVRRLVTRLAAPDADQEVTDEFGAWLWAETRGLPFFIEALLQMLAAEGTLPFTGTEGDPNVDFSAALAQVKSGGHVQVPPGVREAILSRIARLSEKEADLLLAASVLGRECSFGILCQVANVSESGALEAMEALLNGNLLAESSAARRPYTVAHDYIREVVYSDTHEVRRRIFHRRALIALEAERATAAQCAYHAVASLLDEPAFRYSLIAGDEALQSNAFVDSLAHYERARDIAQKMGLESANLAPHLLLRLYQNRGRALELTLRYEAAQANYHELADLAAKRDDAALKLAAIIAQCVICATYTPLFNPDRALELCAAALELAAELRDREAEARALWCLMLVEFHSGGDGQKVLAYGEKALAMARELGLKELQGYVLSNLSWAYWHQLQLNEARRANAEALELWQALGNLSMAVDAYSIRMGIQRLAGEHEALLATGSEAARLSQAIGNALNHYNALLLTGEIHTLQGRLGQALLHFKRAEAISAQSGDDRLLLAHLMYRIPVYLLGGAWEQADALADQVHASLEDAKLIFRDFVLATVAWTKIALGKLQEGEAVLEQVYPALDREAPFSFAVVPLVVADAHLQLALGNPEGALERTGHVIHQLVKAGSRYYLAELLWLQGRAWLALEKGEQAQSALTEAIAVAEDIGERAILWQILATLSDLETVRGHRAGAEDLRCQAREIVCYIADNAGSKALRDSFLAQPAVARVLSERASGGGEDRDADRR